MKHIIMYSGGIGSWAAAKRVIEQHGRENVTLLFTDTLIEDEDLYRFLRETSEQFGCELVWLKDGRDPWQVFKDVRWIGNSRIAQCSHLLKQKVAENWIKAHFQPEEVTLYVGIDWTEIHRLAAIVKHWSPYTVKAPMTEAPYLDKEDMKRLLKADGIKVPRLYEMGFSHNNCGGFCVRAGQGHFINLLKQKRELYLYHEQKEQEMREYLGRDDVSILTRTVNGKEQTLTLRQLREEYENGLGKQIDMFDIGGCGCFANYEAV
jgi:3'-phosphoadenosine 5'-phosphosulfate sulfotransferase (PAPS reductase)/FAD synthetase